MDKMDLLEEENEKRSYIPILIIVLILTVGISVALAVNSKTGFLTGKFANIEVFEINNVNIMNASDKSKVDITLSKKKIHVDVKEMENPTGIITFEARFDNKGKIPGKAYNFRVENKSGDDAVIVRELNNNKPEIAEIKKDESGTMNFTVTIDSKYNTSEYEGKKYNSSFDIVYDSVEVIKEGVN